MYVPDDKYSLSEIIKSRCIIFFALITGRYKLILTNSDNLYWVLITLKRAVNHTKKI